MIRVLHLSGNPRRIGQQHGKQVIDLRPQIQAAIQERLVPLLRPGNNLTSSINEVAKVWEHYAPATLEMLQGMADVLELDWDDYFTYTIASYLTGHSKYAQQKEGCTAWAAGKDVTRDGAPLLAKNRDYFPRHKSLQCLARIQPENGHPYLCLTSAGSPGVFSSGMNASGLAIADTFVASTDLGPGIGRYSLMMDILEKFTRVSDAINYLFSCPHFGDGTVTMADANGELATVEIAHSVQAVLPCEDGFVVSTNHFTAPETRTRWVDNEPPHLKGNSLERRKRVKNALLSARGLVDVPWSQALMGQGGSAIDAICRGPEIDPHSITISCTIFSPTQLGLYVANGLPCQTPFEWFQVAN
jgi:isopenicillin-N N-acyltransferase-like protein